MDTRVKKNVRLWNTTKGKFFHCWKERILPIQLIIEDFTSSVDTRRPKPCSPEHLKGKRGLIQAYFTVRQMKSLNRGVKTVSHPLSGMYF
jgi:hypothetical protein